MAAKSELEAREAQCTTVDDLVSLAKEALADPADPEYTRELLQKAEMQCQMPLDYIKVADVAVMDLKDEDMARGLYAQAEDMLFEVPEFTAYAHSVAMGLKDKEKAREFLEKAADEASQVTDFLAISQVAKADLDDQALAQSLLAKVEEKAKTYEDLKDLAKTLVDSGDAEAARTLFQKAARFCDDPPASVQYARDVTELFDDKDWAHKILDDAEADCQFTKQFAELATGYKTLFDDMDKVNELMEQAAEYCMTGEEHIDLAEGYWKLLGDRDKAAGSYRQALAEITDKDTLLELANRSANELEDTELAKAVYAKAEERMSSASELGKLAKSVVSALKDKDYAAEIYERATQKLVAPNDLMNLAGEVVQQLADKSRATSVYRKAFENSSDLTQLLKLLDNVTTNVQDKDFATEILAKAESLSEASPDLVDVAKKVMEAVGDKDAAARILEAAEESVTSLGELRSVTDTVKQYFSDNADWLARIEEQLTKREANQAKYNAFQERENQARTVLDYLRLADAVMEELDDKFYARKLLTTAEQRYAEGGYDFNLGRELIRAVDHHLGDQDWVQRLLEEAAARCQTFMCIHDVGQTAVNDLADKQLGTSLARSYYQDWQQKLDNANVKRPYDYIKLAKVIGKELADTAWTGNLIDKAAEIGGEHLAFGEMGLSAFAIGETGKAGELFGKALEQCQSPAASTQLAALLKSKGLPSETVKGLYADAKNRWPDSRERLEWVEGIVEVLKDREWAAREYDALAADFASGPEAARFQASRQSRLNLGLW